MLRREDPTAPTLNASVCLSVPDSKMDRKDQLFIVNEVCGHICFVFMVKV